MPNIEQGTTATIPGTGTNAPNASHTWEIRRGGTIVAHNNSAAGWGVARDGSNLVVTCPSDAELSPAGSENYEARYSLSDSTGPGTGTPGTGTGTPGTGTTAG